MIKFIIFTAAFVTLFQNGAFGQDLGQNIRVIHGDEYEYWRERARTNGFNGFEMLENLENSNPEFDLPIGSEEFLWIVETLTDPTNYHDLAFIESGERNRLLHPLSLGGQGWVRPTGRVEATAINLRDQIGIKGSLIVDINELVGARSQHQRGFENQDSKLLDEAEKLFWFHEFLSLGLGGEFTADKDRDYDETIRIWQMYELNISRPAGAMPTPSNGGTRSGGGSLLEILEILKEKIHAKKEKSAQQH